MRLMRFICEECGLEMALQERPDKCFTCGSTRVVREGWKRRFTEEDEGTEDKEEER
jgi:DNA-directed RNA polymerase subunit RPC12/RpoP